MEAGGEGFAGHLTVGLRNREIEHKIGGHLAQGFIQIVRSDGAGKPVFVDLRTSGVDPQIDNGRDFQFLGFNRREPRI